MLKMQTLPKLCTTFVILAHLCTSLLIFHPNYNISLIFVYKSKFPSQDMLNSCRDPKLRPDTKALLSHPFIKMERVNTALTLSNLDVAVPSATVSTSIEIPVPDSAKSVPRPQFLLENLPPNVIVSVLKYLDTLDLAKLTQELTFWYSFIELLQVCKAWQKVMQDDNVWQLICQDWWNTVIVKGAIISC